MELTGDSAAGTMGRMRYCHSGIRIELRAVLLDRSLGVAVIQLYPKAERSVSGAVYRYRGKSLCPAGEQIGQCRADPDIHPGRYICAVVKVAGVTQRVAEGSAANVVACCRTSCSMRCSRSWNRWL